jgi:hypothetical protein
MNEAPTVEAPAKTPREPRLGLADWRDKFDHWVEMGVGLEDFCKEVGYVFTKTRAAFFSKFYRDYTLHMDKLRKLGIENG